MSTYGARPIKRRRRTKEQVEQLERQEVDLEFHRIAITPEQIEDLDLPTKPRKKGDRRALHIHETVEAEAMPAGIMREMLRQAVEEFLPQGAIEAARVAEESERALMLQLADLARAS